MHTRALFVFRYRNPEQKYSGGSAVGKKSKLNLPTIPIRKVTNGISSSSNSCHMLGT